MGATKPPQAEFKPQRGFERRCIWCDSTDHVSSVECSEFREVMQKGLVAINADSRIIDVKTGKEVRTSCVQWRRNERALVLTTNTPVVASTSTITLEEARPVCGKLGPEGTVLVTTLC